MKVMRLLLYILLPLGLFSCNDHYELEQLDKTEEVAQIFSYDFLDDRGQSNFEIIQLDSLRNFSELLREMQRLSCEHKTAGIQFSYQDTIYGLTGYAKCPTDGTIDCYFFRNHFIIENDSIKNYGGDWDLLVPIEDLEGEIQKLSANENNFQHKNPNLLKPALIHLFIDKQHSVEMIKKILKEITQEFKEANLAMGPDYLRYHILFEGYSILNIPPPPPPLPSGK